MPRKQVRRVKRSLLKLRLKLLLLLLLLLLPLLKLRLPSPRRMVKRRKRNPKKRNLLHLHLLNLINPLFHVSISVSVTSSLVKSMKVLIPFMLKKLIWENQRDLVPLFLVLSNGIPLKKWKIVMFWF